MGIRMVNYENGVIRDDSGAVLGNIMAGIIRDGSSKGSGNPLGNVNKGIVRDGSSKGDGNALFNVKGGAVRNGSSVGAGIALGKIADFGISGMETEPAEERVAAYHFLVDKIV